MLKIQLVFNLILVTVLVHDHCIIQAWIFYASDEKDHSIGVGSHVVSVNTMNRLKKLETFMDSKVRWG